MKLALILLSAVMFGQGMKDFAPRLLGTFTISPLTLPAASSWPGYIAIVSDGPCTVTGGDPTLCRSNGTSWVPLGSTGVTYIPTRTSGTILTLPAFAANSMSVGGYYACSTPIATGATFTVSTGTGTLWVALGSDCTIKVRHNIVGACSAGCTAVASSSGFDPTDVPLYTWVVTTNVLASSGTSVLTPYSSMALAQGSNITIICSAGVCTIAAAGSGDVVGPASATGDNLASYNSTTGKLIKDSGLPSASSGTGNMLRVSDATAVNLTVNGNLKFGAHAIIDTDFDYSAYNNAFRICFTDNSGVGTGFDIGMSRNAAGVMEFNSCTPGTLRDIKMRSVVAGGTSPTVTPGTIGTGSRNAAGFITSATTGVFTPVLTFNGTTAPVGWTCAISNNTTANLIRQTAYTTTTATFSGTTVSGDVVTYNCTAF